MLFIYFFLLIKTFKKKKKEFLHGSCGRFFGLLLFFFNIHQYTAPLIVYSHMSFML